MQQVLRDPLTKEETLCANLEQEQQMTELVMFLPIISSLSASQVTEPPYHIAAYSQPHKNETQVGHLWSNNTST